MHSIPGTLASNFTYGATSVEQFMLGNGAYERVDMNNRLQPCRMRVNASSMSATNCTATDPTGDILQMKYGFTASGVNNGNVMSWSASGSAGLSFTRSYTYDDLNRLKTMSSTGACAGLEWTYDVWANRTHQITTGGTCNQSQLTINTSNRIADANYGYDSAGNLTSEPGKTYQYDAENRMVSIGNGCPSTTCYTYNAEGQRVRKIAASTTTEYIYGIGGYVVAEKVGTTWTVGYVFANGQLVAQYKDSTTYAVHKDHLGSTRLLTKMDKTKLEDPYDYYPYGEPLGTSGSGTKRKFTGHERDAESSLDYMTTRHYASSTGRFLSIDSILLSAEKMEDPQQFNLYHYVRNNPLHFVDPTGEEIRLADLSDEERAMLIAALEEATGFKLKYNKKSGNLQLDGAIKDAKGISSSFRHDLAEAISSKDIYNVISKSEHDGAKVNFAVFDTRTKTTVLDFSDFAKVPGLPLASLFYHETIGHGLRGLTDDIGPYRHATGEIEAFDLEKRMEKERGGYVRQSYKSDLVEGKYLLRYKKDLPNGQTDWKIVDVTPVMAEKPKNK